MIDKNGTIRIHQSTKDLIRKRNMVGRETFEQAIVRVFSEVEKEKLKTTK